MFFPENNEDVPSFDERLNHILRSIKEDSFALSVLTNQVDNVAPAIDRLNTYRGHVSFEYLGDRTKPFLTTGVFVNVGYDRRLGAPMDDYEEDGVFQDADYLWGDGWDGSHLFLGVDFIRGHGADRYYAEIMARRRFAFEYMQERGIDLFIPRVWALLKNQQGMPLGVLTEDLSFGGIGRFYDDLPISDLKEKRLLELGDFFDGSFIKDGSSLEENEQVLGMIAESVMPDGESFYAFVDADRTFHRSGESAKIMRGYVQHYRENPFEITLDI